LNMGGDPCPSFFPPGEDVDLSWARMSAWVMAWSFLRESCVAELGRPSPPRLEGSAPGSVARGLMAGGSVAHGYEISRPEWGSTAGVALRIGLPVCPENLRRRFSRSARRRGIRSDFGGSFGQDGLTGTCCNKCFATRTPSFRPGSPIGNPLESRIRRGLPEHEPERKLGALDTNHLLQQERTGSDWPKSARSGGPRTTRRESVRIACRESASWWP
jgi:hypothetical protein